MDDLILTTRQAVETGYWAVSKAARRPRETEAQATARVQYFQALSSLAVGRTTVAVEGQAAAYAAEVREALERGDAVAALRAMQAAWSTAADEWLALRAGRKGSK